MEREFQVATRRLVASLDAFEAVLRAARVREATVLDLRLVAEEVLTNVAKHGHDDGEEHSVRLRLTILAVAVRLEFADDGRAFDPLSAAPPDLEAGLAERALGGLGLPLIRSLVDAAEYARVNDRNVLTLTKRLDDPPDVT